MPPANRRNTVATGIRRCLTHGTPPICAGSTVMRSKFLITFPCILSQANPSAAERLISGDRPSPRLHKASNTRTRAASQRTWIALGFCGSPRRSPTAPEVSYKPLPIPENKSTLVASSREIDLALSGKPQPFEHVNSRCVDVLS